MHALIMLVSLLGADPDPLGDFKPILTKMEKEGTAERVAEFSGPGKWQKRQYKATKIKYDVQKTTSLVTPFTASVKWDLIEKISETFPTKEKAEKAALGDSQPFPIPWNASFAFQDGKWVVTDVWWSSELNNLEGRHSTEGNGAGPNTDWWWALGGK